MVRNIENAEFYTWGEKCFGWHMVKNESLSIIEELMPPGTTEVKHYHKNCQQFFYILRGVAKFDVEEKLYEVKANEGIHILPNITHKIFNESSGELRFLVISEPPSRNDRYE